MVKPVDWTALEQRLDYIVDGRFAEPVILIPWVKGTTVYITAEEGPDPSRKMLVTTGCYVTPGAAITGEAGRALGGGFNTQVVEQKVWLSVTLANIGSITAWQSSDLVFFPMRNKFFNIDYVEDSATLRPNIYLIVEKGILTGTGSPTKVIPPSQFALYFDTQAYDFYRAIGATGTSADWVALNQGN